MVNPEEKEKYRSLIDFYFKIKELIIAAEKIDHEQVIPLTAISEIRNALDHIMRAHAAEHGIVTCPISGLELPEYWNTQIDKTFAHLYRAGYDSYDLISISLIDEINKILDPISQKALHAVIPNAFERVAAPYREAKKAFVQAKVGKDIESADSEKRHFDEYEKSIEKLTQLRDFLNERAEDLSKYDREQKIKICIGIILSTLAGGAITLFLQYLL